MYGVFEPPLPHEPDVTLTDFSYTPASPIRIGDTLTFRATLNRHTDAGWMVAVVNGPELNSWGCFDDGVAPDEHAGDGIYTGAMVWEAWRGSGENLPVYAELHWDDDFPGPILAGPPLTILPEIE